MGSLIGQLTNQNSALVTPEGQPSFMGSPSQVLSKANAGLPSPTAMMGTDVLNPQDTGAAQHLPHIGRPSFLQAANTGPGGTPNALSPGLSKAGKLVTLLTAGLKGAVAGRAAQEQMIAQTGGHRAGGFGTGFQAGAASPYQTAALPLGLEKEQTELATQQAGLKPVQTPYGQMPASFASKLFPAMVTGEYGVKKAGIEAGAKKDVAATQAQTQQQIHRYIPVTGVGMFDTQTRQVMPGTAQGITITPEIAQDHNLPEQFIGKPMKLSELSQMERVENQQTTTVQGASGPSLVNKKTAQVTPLGLGNPSMGRPLQVGDPNNPGETTFTTGAQAVAQGASGPQSASVQVPRAAAKAEVPTKIGDQKVAFTTMISHAELLRKAAKALNNGDVRVLNMLSNRAQTEFGDPALTNFEAIANAYNHEVTTVVAKGHMTDSEVASGGRTMPANANYKTIDQVLNSYQALAKSKMENLNKQQQNAIKKSQPKKPSTDAPTRTIVF